MLAKTTKKTITILSLLFIPLLAACSPEQLAIWNSLTPGEQQAVIAYNERQKTSRDCNQAVDRHFSGNKDRMKRVVWRESTNNPAAKNPRSSAKGCAQLLHSLHSHRYTAVGCSPSEWRNPDCNIKAADHLFREQGWRPWSLTAY